MSDRELRIGDAERTAAADELAEHYAQGRLSPEEHHERLDRIWAARTRSDLAPMFSDLPGSAFQRPTTYAAADRPGVGQEPQRRGHWAVAAPSYGRSSYGRSSYAGPGRGARSGWAMRRFRALPTLVKLALVGLLVVLVVAHLPLILIGLLVWFVLAHQGGCGPRRHRG